MRMTGVSAVFVLLDRKRRICEPVCRIAGSVTRAAAFWGRRCTRLAGDAGVRLDMDHGRWQARRCFGAVVFSDTCAVKPPGFFPLFFKPFSAVCQTDLS